MAMLAVSESTLLIVVTVIFFFGLGAVVWLMSRIGRSRLRSTLAFMYFVICACAFAWVGARLHGEAFLRVRPALVLVVGGATVCFVSSLLWPRPPIETKVRGLWLFWAALIPIAVLLFLKSDDFFFSGDPEGILSFLALILVVSLLPFFLPRRFFRVVREKERLEAQREEGAQRDSEHPEKQEGAEPE